MASHAVPRAKLFRMPRFSGVGAPVVVGVAATALIGAGAFAAWTSSSSSTTGTYSAATVTHTNTDTNGTTFTTAISNLLPGDYAYRYRTLVNTGSVAQTFSGAVSGSGALAGSGGLTLAVDSCPIAWVGNVCATPSSVLGTAGVSTSPSISYGSLAASTGTMYLRYTIALPSAADQSTFQGTSGTVTVAVTGTPTAVGDRTAG